MRDLDELAKEARNRKSDFGPDVDLDEFAGESAPYEYVEDLSRLASAEKERLLAAGIDPGESGRSGTFMQKDSSVIHARSRDEGLEIIPIRQALAQHDWIHEYYWRLARVDTDKFTARARLDLQDGYVIRALPGRKIRQPVQACLYLDKNGFSQNVHNIIIAEEDSELHMITGCATSPHLRRGLHVGISEFFVKRNARLSFTMVHNWGEEVIVRPRSVGRVETGGLLLNNYICMKPVRSLQMYPTTQLEGEDAVARFYSLLVGSPASEMDVGGRIILKQPGSRAEIISRAITNGGRIIARGDLVGEVRGIKAHLECRGLILNGGLMHAIPELMGKVDGVEMSHEAAVGKIAQEEILYLMSRGLSEDEATATIVRGFLSVDIPGLPPDLKAQIDRAVEQSDRDMM